MKKLQLKVAIMTLVILLTGNSVWSQTASPANHRTLYLTRGGGLLKTILPALKSLALMILAGRPLICRMTGALKTCHIKQKIRLSALFQRHPFLKWVWVIQLAVQPGIEKALR